ncbi:MAG: hypothetical protein H6739_12350 [Alphaproteobacteria bacterium]|nr:hypothetical protein [Alphaproteobacteria bacterium]
MERPSSSAVVLGAGVAGMLAAQALSKHFGTVTLLDRRPLDADGTFTTGVAQSDHLHVMLQGGQFVIDRAFPGLMEECAVSPDMTNDWGPETFWVSPFGPYPQQKTPVTTWQFSRKILDRRMLKRLMALPNVSVRSAKVRGLVGEPGRITGVEVDLPEAEGPTVLHADLVADCRGRNSPLVKELVGLGYPEPPITRVDNQLGYASQFFQLPEGETATWKLTYLQAREGIHDRGGALCAYADGSLIAILIGYGDDRPTADPQEFLAFARSLPRAEVFADLERAQPVGNPKIWRNLGNCRRHFGRMARWPRGLIALGDAACHFNPVYGQGMTVSAIEAEALDKLLAGTPDPRSQPWERAFQQKLERLVLVPWTRSVTEDQRSRQANPSLPTRVLQGYVDQVLRGAVQDPVLHSAFLRVMHMVSSPASLFSPPILARVMARSAGRRLRPPPAEGVHLLPTPEHVNSR